MYIFNCIYRIQIFSKNIGTKINGKISEKISGKIGKKSVEKLVKKNQCKHCWWKIGGKIGEIFGGKISKRIGGKIDEQICGKICVKIGGTINGKRWKSSNHYRNRWENQLN